MRSSYCIFYSDGFWIEGCCEHDRDFINNVQPKIPSFDKWGVYHISGDTVKIRYLYTVQVPYDAWDCWYLIENRERINLIINTRTQPITEWMLQLEQRKFPDGQKFTFVQKDSLPDMNLSWFKQSKWLWCDKVAYEKWKASQ